MLGRVMPTAIVLLLGACTAACARQQEVVDWSEPSRQSADSLPGKLGVDVSGPVYFKTPPIAVNSTLLLPAGACRASVRVAWSGASGSERYAVWWSARPDSSAALLASRSTNGGTSWDPPLRVDSLDRSDVGCARPAPAVAVDSVTGYVHVAYAMHAPEGMGVFFAHAMDRGAMYHSPVAIVYGDRLVDVDVAALRDTVVVAYSDPNMKYPRVGLALSRTMGHIFEVRMPSVARAGSGNAVAVTPAVALAPGRIALAWIERDIDGPRTLVTMLGRLHLAAAP